MNFADFFERHWGAIAASPSTFAIAGFIVAAATVALTRAVLGGALEASRERLAGAKDEIDRLKGEKSVLFGRLEAHGDDIAALKKEFAAQPRIHVSDRPPGPDDRPRDGDVWIQYESDAKAPPN